MRRLLPLLAAALAACASAPPPYPEAPPALRRLHAAVFWSGDEEAGSVEDWLEVFERTFGTVSTPLAASQAKDSDVVVRLAVRRTRAGSLFGRGTVEADAALSRPDGTPLDELRVRSSQHGKPPLTSGAEIDDLALRRAQHQLAEGLVRSTKLSEFARMRRP